MLDWKDIDTVLLDMDGTVLDLHFDNYFWEEFVPSIYGERHGLSATEASRLLRSRYEKVKGTLDWYCLDFWSSSLALDIPRLKEDIRHKIALRPHATQFLQQLRASGREVLLVTNAHPQSLALKMQTTGIDHHFHRTISSHALQLAKENPGFWHALREEHPFEPARTLLVDDNLAVLRQAREEGIAHLLGVQQPDSQRPPLAPSPEFRLLHHFTDILPGLQPR
jgi:HAD superfamily hydrolase (TIGR01509 family)